MREGSYRLCDGQVLEHRFRRPVFGCRSPRTAVGGESRDTTNAILVLHQMTLRYEHPFAVLTSYMDLETAARDRSTCQGSELLDRPPHDLAVGTIYGNTHGMRGRKQLYWQPFRANQETEAATRRRRAYQEVATSEAGPLVHLSNFRPTLTVSRRSSVPSVYRKPATCHIILEG